MKGKVHVLGDALSLAPYISANNLEAKPNSVASYLLNLTLPENKAENYEHDQLFGLYYNDIRAVYQKTKRKGKSCIVCSLTSESTIISYIIKENYGLLVEM